MTTKHTPEPLKELLSFVEGMLQQAEAQFKCGDRHATFNRQTINWLREYLAAAKGEKP